MESLCATTCYTNFHVIQAQTDKATFSFFNLISEPIRIFKCSFLGDIGFELHIPRQKIVEIYNEIWRIGKEYGLQNAGFRAFNSLNCANGKYLIL